MKNDYTSIRLKQFTRNELSKKKVHKNQSYDEVIMKMILDKEKTKEILSGKRRK